MYFNFKETHDCHSVFNLITTSAAHDPLLLLLNTCGIHFYLMISTLLVCITHCTFSIPSSSSERAATAFGPISLFLPMEHYYSIMSLPRLCSVTHGCVSLSAVVP